MFRFSKSARYSLLLVFLLLALIASKKRDVEGQEGVAIPTANIPGTTKIATPPPVKPEPPKPRPDLLVGDHSLLGELRLASMRLADNGQYEVPLRDGSVAILTLDPVVQKAANKVLEQAKAPMGAIVVMRRDGRILALAGLRNVPTRQHRSFDLALSVWAPAASIFKIVTAAALVSSGVSPTSKVCYHGGLRSVERSNLVDGGRRDSTCNDLGYGVAKSQNALVAKLVHRHLSREALAKMAEVFGLRAVPKFSLTAEAGHLELPADDLEYARVSAGFWKSRTSVLGGALIANLVASKGLKVPPRIVAEVRESDRVIPVTSVAPEQVLSAKTAEAVAEMMAGSVKYGTAAKAFRDRRGRPYLGGTKVAGKTGSLSRKTPSYLAYSWFVGFAPVDDPEIVISVLLGNSALWHLKAHTAARLVLDSIF